MALSGEAGSILVGACGPFVPSTASTRGTVHVSGMEVEAECCGNATAPAIAAAATEKRMRFLEHETFPAY